MNREQLTAEIRSMVARIIKQPEDRILPDANLFSDLGVDSLLGVEIIASLDRKYSLDVPEGRLKDIKTLNDIVEMVASFLANK
ncbi:MAG: acyl carrier protein [Candidatus Saganbacteria bacterium]|nr:acyl carrier protein [Candidatus Saganbacteria bacterium]